MYNDELYHYGRKGMKWGQHIYGKIKAREKRIIDNYNTKEKQAVINYQKGKRYKITADSGKHRMVNDHVPYKRGGILTYNIVDDRGDIKLTYYKGKFGYHILATGKEYVDNHKLIKENFNTKFLKDYRMSEFTEYDVYK